MHERLLKSVREGHRGRGQTYLKSFRSPAIFRPDSFEGDSGFGRSVTGMSCTILAVAAGAPSLQACGGGVSGERVSGWVGERGGRGLRQDSEAIARAMRLRWNDNVLSAHKIGTVLCAGDRGGGGEGAAAAAAAVVDVL